MNLSFATPTHHCSRRVYYFTMETSNPEPSVKTNIRYRDFDSRPLLSYTKTKSPVVPIKKKENMWFYIL